MVHEAKAQQTAGKPSGALEMYLLGLAAIFDAVPAQGLEDVSTDLKVRREVEELLRETEKLKDRLDQEAKLPTPEEAIEQSEAMLRAAGAAEADGLDGDAEAGCQLALRSFLRTLGKLMEAEAFLDREVLKQRLKAHLARPGCLLQVQLKKQGLRLDDFFGLLTSGKQPPPPPPPAARPLLVPSRSVGAIGGGGKLLPKKPVPAKIGGRLGPPAPPIARGPAIGARLAPPAAPIGSKRAR